MPMAAAITRKNKRRDARADVAKEFNNLAQELGVNFAIPHRLPTEGFRLQDEGLSLACRH